MRSCYQRIMALLLAALLVIGKAPAVYAAEVPDDENPDIRIGSAEELLTFSKNCATESYSQDLSVVITADIDLAGIEFPSIPIFCGTLDGGGYTISGFVCEAKGSSLGLFRCLTETAAVKNLNVSGTVRPSGTASTVGILAGQNDGSIIGCSVTGTVTGVKETGGLVGKNTSTGEILSCMNDAVVSGEAYTGGIAGLNEGTITASSNSGKINGHNNYSYTDTGGIAGRSSGWVEECANYGEIGYEQNGYNSGGIAGFHNGVIADCQNHAPVRGRKDIGGIAGQFEPNVDKLEHESKLDKLDREMATLSNLFREFSDTLEANLDSTKDNVDDLRGVMDDTKDILTTAKDEATDEWGDTIDSIEARARRLEREIDDLTDNTTALGDSVYRSIESVLRAIQNLRDALAQAKSNADDALLAAIESIEAHLDSIEDELRTIRAIIEGVLSQIRDDPPGQGGEDLDIPGELAQIQASAASILTHSAAVIREVAAISGELAEAAGQNPGYFSDLVDALKGAIDRLSNDIPEFVGGAADNLDNIKRLISRLADTVSDQADSSRSRVDRTSDSIEDQMDAIETQIDYITDNVSDHADSLGNVTDRITDQLDVIRDIAVNEERQEFSVDDISDDWNGTIESGSIVSCVNTGGVSGDYHVGGIAGMVAHEIFEDPEADLELSDTVLGNVTALVRATLRANRNSGSVTSKKDYAGGIVGRADVGAVIDCVNTGNVETTDGNYCGGIAGASNYSILRSHSLAVLTGNDNVGGIAGRGRDIQGCYAMPTIHSDGEMLGAIAGSLVENSTDGDTETGILDTILAERPEIIAVSLFNDEAADDKPEVRDNFFLEEDIAGIDGVNYADAAEALPYEQFSAIEDLPDDFLQFGVTFMANEKVIRSFSLAYGDAFDVSLTPDCPEVDGQVGQWPEFDASHILRHVVVEAEYTPWLTSISTDEAQPLFLIEGRFSGNATVAVTPYIPGDVMIPQGYASAEGYTFSVTDNGKPVTGEMTIRVRCESNAAELLWISGGNATLLGCTRDGSYLVAQVPGSGSVLILTEKGNAAMIMLVVGTVLAVIAMTVILHKRKLKPVAQQNDKILIHEGSLEEK